MDASYPLGWLWWGIRSRSTTIPWDAEESVHLERTKTWLADARQPLNRDCFNPGHAVGSTFVVSPGGRVALILHSKLGRWLQPGGHAEPGERDLREVAARETREELGIDVEPASLLLFDIDVHTIPARKADPQHLHFDFRYLYRARDEEFLPATDAADARWFVMSELSGMDLDRGMQRMVAKGIARGLLSG